MNDQLSHLRDHLVTEANGLASLVSLRGTLIQVTALVACFVAATLLARLIEPAVEVQARKIRGEPRVLRVVIAFIRRLRLFLFVLFLWLASLALSSAIAPDPNALLVVAKLALAYFVIAVTSRIVRNRLLARAITIVAWVYAALSVLHWTDPVGSSLDKAAIFIGQARISVLLVLKAMIVLAATLWIASLVGRFLDARVQRSEELTPTLRVLIGKFLKIGLILIALAVALASIGIDLTALTVLSGAVGVGLGFGLQKVVSNFVSGIIILLDRSIKPGDTITVGNTFGWIRELRARFVSVVTRDGREYLIPNEDFITSRVVNWSFTDELVRIDVTFGVSYESDPHEVTRIAKEATAGVPRVVSSKPVVCWMTGFGESSLDFVVRFWITDPQQGLTNVKGEVLLALWDGFKANGINIPFPVRDVILRPPAAAPDPPRLLGA
jgi:small-conductance mechanosensitive channel